MNSTKRFTLLEIMLAVLLLGMLMTLVFTISGSIVRKWDVVEEVNHKFEDVLVLERLFSNSFANSIPFNWRSPDNYRDEFPTFIGEEERISFCYRQPVTRIKDGGLMFMGLEVEDGQLKVSTYNRPWVNLDEPSDAYEINYLSNGIEEIRFQYAVSYRENDEVIVEWMDYWPDNDKQNYDHPLAIRIDVIWEEFKETFLYRTAGNGQFERFGDWQPRRTPEGFSSAGSSSGSQFDKDKDEDDDNNLPPGGGPGGPF